jgi:hypothetical protein
MFFFINRSLEDRIGLEPRESRGFVIIKKSTKILVASNSCGGMLSSFGAGT